MRSKVTLVAIGSSLLLALAVGCSNEQTAEQKQAPASTATAPQETASPQGEAAGPGFPLTGKVVESFDSGGYSYLRLETASGDYWVATAQSGVKEGEEVTVPNGQMMQNFHSRTLDRTFPEIIFAAGLAGNDTPKTVGTEASGTDSFAEALQKETGQQQPGMGAGAGMMGSTKAIAPPADIDVEKAAGENGYRVGEIFEQASQLDGKEVQVRGKVVKVSPGIMGRNWIHLQDGSGAPEQNTHDLVVTSAAAQPDKGEVVTIKGVLHANKDFGSGYRYDAIVEDAEIIEP